MAAIGVFDSGIGGLSVLREIRALLPHEDLYYLADSRHAPYGPKPEAYIIERSLACCEFLRAQGVKAIVVACNTATAAAVKTLRARYPLPIIAMEPGIKPAVAASQNGVIGVLATSGTLSSARFSALLQQYSGTARIITQPCPGLVEQIEEGELHAPRLQSLLQRYLAPLLEAGVDTIILGCTHYPLVRAQIQALAGREVQLIDTGAAVAQQVQRVLREHHLLAPAGALGVERFWSSGDPAHAQDVLRQLWGGEVEVAPMVASPGNAG